MFFNRTFLAPAIVGSTLTLLADLNSRFVFSTHLLDIDKLPVIRDYMNKTDGLGIETYHIEVVTNDKGNLVFTRKLRKGGISIPYGLESAQQLGLNEEFMKRAYIMRNSITNTPDDILTTKTSKYNTKVYMDKCNRCGTTKNLITHHIDQQKTADNYGIIKKDNKVFHKNLKSNLEVLCEKCHDEHHHTHGK